MNESTPENMATTKPIIAVDGTAASGKGTLARKLAAHYGLFYLDTGALYRLVGWQVLQTGGDPADPEDAIGAAEALAAAFTHDKADNPDIRSDEAGVAASKVAAIPEVREILLDLQRDVAARPPSLPNGGAAKGAVLDGRDIGTVICPQADAKLFVTADVAERAKRRFKELQSAGIGVTYEAVLAQMRDRDARDAGRSVAPMKPAEDAVVLDTTDMTIAQVLEKALDLVAGACPALCGD